MEATAIPRQSRTGTYQDVCGIRVDKSRTHIFRQRQQGAQQSFFALVSPLPALTLPAAQPQAGNSDDQDRAIGQTGEEERVAESLPYSRMNWPGINAARKLASLPKIAL